MDLFDDLPQTGNAREEMAPGAVLLRGWARASGVTVLQAVEAVIAQSPLRHMQTPGGYTMSVATTSCGALGWVSDPHGYRYAAHDPHTRQPWPAMPPCLLELAQGAAAEAGYDNFRRKPA